MRDDYVSDWGPDLSDFLEKELASDLAEDLRLELQEDAWDPNYEWPHAALLDEIGKSLEACRANARKHWELREHLINAGKHWELREHLIGVAAAALAAVLRVDFEHAEALGMGDADSARTTLARLYEARRKALLGI